MITVKRLREAIANLPDDAPILVKPMDSAEFASHMSKHERANLPKWVVPWNYNTREVYIVYACNDDRYEQNNVLCIELGDMSP